MPKISGNAGVEPQDVEQIAAELFRLSLNLASTRRILLHGPPLDTVPKFIQLIKLVQQELGIGNARVRAPKLELVGEELESTRKLIRHAIQNRPKNASSALAHAAR